MNRIFYASDDVWAELQSMLDAEQSTPNRPAWPEGADYPDQEAFNDTMLHTDKLD